MVQLDRDNDVRKRTVLRSTQRPSTGNVAVRYREADPLPSSMDWVTMLSGGVAAAVIPTGYVIVFLRRRRTRALTRHDTTPPSPHVTTGQRR